MIFITFQTAHATNGLSYQWLLMQNFVMVKGLYYMPKELVI
jgi:hypothetical protein